MTLPAYRALLRAARTVFAGDVEGLKMAQGAAREEFRKNAGAPADEIDRLVAEARDAREFLLNNVVQAAPTEHGYAATVLPRHTTDAKEPGCES